jgi:hypothetical protein
MEVVILGLLFIGVFAGAIAGIRYVWKEESPWVLAIVVPVSLAFFLGFGWMFAESIPMFNRSLTVHSGIVIDKTYTPAHTTTTMLLVGKIMVPQTQYYPESWSVTISGRNEDGERDERTMSVPGPAWDTVEIGETVVVD